MSLAKIGIQRLYHQRISLPNIQTPGDVVAWLGAMQAQDYLGTLWAVGLRMPNATEAMIEQAIAEKKIMRTWTMRGTLHFAAPQEVRWMLQLLTPRVIARSAKLYRDHDLTPDVFARCQDLFIAALQGGKQFTRDEMYQIMDTHGIPSAKRGIHVLGYLAQTGLLCFGTRQGKQQTFTLLDEWLPPGRTLTHVDALAEIAQRYFNSHSPATVKDFAWWTGLTLTDARLGLEAVQSQLSAEKIAGETYWIAPYPPEAAIDEEAVFLLPGFDEFLLGYTDRSASLPADRVRQWQRGNAMLFSMIVIAGKVAGFWKRTLKKDTVIIEPIFFRPFTPTEHTDFEAAVARYAAFLGLSNFIITP